VAVRRGASLLLLHAIGCVADAALQVEQPTTEIGGDGALVQPQHCGDLAVSQVTEEAQRHDLPPTGRERRQLRVQGCARFAAKDELVRRQVGRWLPGRQFQG